MAAGKSTIAPLLAHALGWRVLDTDAEIVERAGKNVARIFAEDGEAAFRRMESELTAALSSGDPVVVAPGGGWIANEASRAIREDPATRVVWLRISAAEALRRAKLDSVERPLLAGATEEVAGRLLAERESLYATADYAVDVDGRVAEQVVDDILKWLRTNTS
jgi:shikimate kinase